jgi:hypothetical protein
LGDKWELGVNGAIIILWTSFGEFYNLAFFLKRMLLILADYLV